jgi:3-hydroxy-9,10-secoandrosta-1,3,5(10)-triene-9,17-dione monooxygenase reductase component
VTQPVDSAAFRRTMGRWATGVAVVTAREGENDAGLTVNALLSVSLAPPSLLISLTRDADTTPLIERSGRFAASFLAADQRSLSERFARTVPPAEKFRGLAVHRSPGGLALLDGALAGLECRVVSKTPAFDHLLIVGEVVFQELGRDDRPLLFVRSGYAEPEGSDALRLPSAPP